MKKLLGVLCVVILLAATGCAVVHSPVSGIIVTDTKSSGTNTLSERGPKVGQSECTSILGLVATGDCRVSSAAQNGGIKKVKTVKYHSYSILGIYAKYTTTVIGE